MYLTGYSDYLTGFREQLLFYHLIDVTQVWKMSSVITDISVKSPQTRYMYSFMAQAGYH